MCKKQLPIGPNQGFLLEVLMLLLPAMVFVTWLLINQKSHFIILSWHDTWLLIGCGAVTAIPLMLYANGAKRLRLTSIAILQYAKLNPFFNNYLIFPLVFNCGLILIFNNIKS